MKDLNQPLQFKKPINHFKFILIIILVALAIFMIIFTISVLKTSKKINKLQTELNISGIDLKQFLRETYTPAIQKTIEGENNYWIGSEQPIVTIVEFGDFACPFTKKSYKTMRELAIEYGDDVKIIFRDRPAFKYSLELSMAAYCAGEQGKFWPMHDKLFQYQSANLGSDINELIILAKQLGVETEQFSKCLTDKKYFDQIKKNFLEAGAIGVSGTPTWFVNGKEVQGVIPKLEWQNLLNKLIK